jgi:flagellar basal-body rod protein FlgB
MSFLFKPSLSVLERSLDTSALRQKVISNNIANADTPFFKRSEVEFEDVLQNAMSETKFVGLRTNSRHVAIGRGVPTDIMPEVIVDDKTLVKNNHNNVDIDLEMAQMSKNAMRYNVLVERMSKEFKGLRTAIEGR